VGVSVPSNGKGETVNRKDKFMKKLKYVSIVTALALVVMASVVYGKIVSEATGKGAFLDSAGNTVNMQFKAGVDNTGTFFGEVQQTTKLPGPDAFWHGTVLCYEELSEDTAVFAGVIDSSSDPSLEGQFFEVEVVDNAPDEYGFEFSNRQPDCDHLSVRSTPIIRGSIQVH
jgi:hypothetical protein